MKNILLIALLFICITANAQVTIIPATDTAIYVGIENSIIVKSGKIPLDELKLRTSAGTVSGGNGRYTVLCPVKTADAVLEVIFKNKIVANKKVQVRAIGDPIACALGDRGIISESILKKQLGELKSLITKCKPPLIKFKVVSFTAEIIHNGQPMGTVNNNSDVMSKETRMYLQSAMPGDEIVFDSIKVLGPTDSHPKVVPSVKLRII